MNLDLFDDTQESTEELPFDFPDRKGYSYYWDKNLNGFLITIPNGELFYSEYFLDKKISDRSIEYFLENFSNDWKKVDWRCLEKKIINH